ncbi:heme/copper-type cytochrome/quinol oxidase, subunit 3 [Xenococcus sp. PCC 7305]|uniref:cytochrome c oxidase subunit 3 n=1 Tax=Xenococcus sp. PCC 7305 TaxID=102125 RepID=UPI0002AC69FE|nr:heme-copper oxidase subunit III [Xenococcus sp. PCC 7305]ELS04340.1 heme/copper-type cytochrome/quinol oxidase, subunit 3 [Xenococcus sp. PCC 7305]
MQSSALDQSQVIVDSHQDSGHHGHPDHRMFGIFLFLISDSMTFLGLFAAFLIYRSMAPVWPPEGTPELELLVPIINTVILVTSSFVMHKGQVALKKNDVAGLQLWFGITALMGIAFLCGQGYEYFHAEFGLTTNLFSSCFFAVTGFHGLHVTVGVLLILSVLWRSREEGHYSSASHFGVEAAEIYWHFVDVIWLVLFILVYLL